MDCCSPRWSLKSITVICHNLMEASENGARANSARFKGGLAAVHRQDAVKIGAGPWCHPTKCVARRQLIQRCLFVHDGDAGMRAAAW